MSSQDRPVAASPDRGADVFRDQRVVRKAEGLNASQKLLLEVIHGRARNGRGVCFASNATLAADIGEDQPKPDGRKKGRRPMAKPKDEAEARALRLESATKNIRNWLKALREAGWIVDLDDRRPTDPRPSRLAMGPKFQAAVQAEAATPGAEARKLNSEFLERRTLTWRTRHGNGTNLGRPRR